MGFPTDFLLLPMLHDLTEKDDEVRMMRSYIHSVPDA